MLKKSSSQNDIIMQYFQEKNHNFNNRAKVILIEKLNNTTTVNWKEKLLDSNIRNHILKRVPSRIQWIKILKTFGLLFHVHNCYITRAAWQRSSKNTILLDEYLTSYQFCKLYNFKNTLENCSASKLVRKTYLGKFFTMKKCVIIIHPLLWRTSEFAKFNFRLNYGTKACCG